MRYSNLKAMQNHAIIIERKAKVMYICWTTFSRTQCCATLDDLSLILNHYMFVKLPSDWFYQIWTNSNWTTE